MAVSPGSPPWDAYLDGLQLDRIGASRVLVTGGSGFIGTNLVQALLAGGYEAVNLDHQPPRHPGHAAVWRRVDLLDGAALARELRVFDPEIVLHLAARTDLNESDGEAGYAANDVGTANLIVGLEGLDSLQRLVVTSSQLVCRPGYIPTSDTDYDPHTEYGRSKVRAEQVVRDWARPTCPWTIVRPTSIWGPWFREPYRDFFMAVAGNRFVNARGVDPLRSFGFVGNVVNQYLRIAAAPADVVAGRVLYVSDLETTKLREWAATVQAEIGSRRIRDVPVWLLSAAGKLGVVLKKVGWAGVPLTSFRLRNMLGDNVADMSPTRRLIGADPFTTVQGVRTTVAWMRSEGLVRR